MFDAHCHAWQHWPYQPPVPDPDSRGTIEQLLHEMDRNGVERALIVCAEIDDNPDNNAYVAKKVRAHPDRLSQVVDVDSKWKPTYHQPGAADRMKAALDQFSPAGFTHYLADDDDGAWLHSDDGLAFFEVADERDMIASIHCRPRQQAAIRHVAQNLPDMPILLHHMGHPKVSEPESINEILASAAYKNIYIKVSGFYYATAGASWNFPLADVQPFVKALYEAYGARRMCWGSDYPVAPRYDITYRQTLEIFRTRCDFIPAADREIILNETLTNLLDGKQ